VWNVSGILADFFTAPESLQAATSPLLKLYTPVPVYIFADFCAYEISLSYLS
jgi:hypothetical protein